VALACVVAAAWLATLVFGDAALAPLLAVGLLGAPVQLINTLLGQVLRNTFRAVPFTVLNLVTVALTVGLGIALVVGARLGPLGVLIGVLVAQLVILPVRALTARDAFAPRFDRALLGRLLAYGVPLVPTSLAFWVFLTSDRLLLGRLSTLDQLGLYSVAVSLVGLANVAIAALGQAWTPHLIRHYEEDKAEASWFVGRMLVYCVAGFGLLAVGLTALAPEALAILSGDAFHGASAAVGPLALGMVAYASVSMTGAGISLMKQTKYLAIHAWVAAVVNVVLNVVLDPPFGMVGAAWATAIAYGYLTLAYLATSQRLWAIDIPVRKAVATVALVVAFTAVASVLPTGPLLPAILLKGLFAAAYVVALLVAGIVGRREIDYALSLGRGMLEPLRRRRR